MSRFDSVSLFVVADRFSSTRQMPISHAISSLTNYFVSDCQQGLSTNESSRLLAHLRHFFTSLFAFSSPFVTSSQQTLLVFLTFSATHPAHIFLLSVARCKRANCLEPCLFSAALMCYCFSLPEILHLVESCIISPFSHSSDRYLRGGIFTLARSSCFS